MARVARLIRSKRRSPVGGSAATWVRPAAWALSAATSEVRPWVRKAEEAGISNVTFSRGDFTEYALPSEPYDVVLGLSILHLLHDRKAALARVKDLLKPGGVFVSSTPCLTELGALRGILPVMRMVGKAPYVQVFSPEQIAADHTEAGFQIIHQWQPKKKAAVFLVARKT